MEEILNEFQAADVVVMASPVYFRAKAADLKLTEDEKTKSWIYERMEEICNE